MSLRPVLRIGTLLMKSSDKVSRKQSTKTAICTVSQSNNNNDQKERNLMFISFPLIKIIVKKESVLMNFN